MPMQKNSTLIYFVNHFNESQLLHFGEVDFCDIENALTMMGNEDKVPSKQSIKNILDFARCYDVLETKDTGYVEMNLN
ncbi:MAG: hypothetical protein CSA36_03260 [Draconibacterium sp.]|nr:MAG: hypothetical protein CSA36_03260 [Draconibacterium sp.]